MKKKQSSSESRFTAYPVVLSSKGFDPGWHRWMTSLSESWGFVTTSFSRRKRDPCQDREWSGDYGSCGMVTMLNEGLFQLFFLERKSPDPDMCKSSFDYLNGRSHIHSFTDKLSEALM